LWSAYVNSEVEVSGAGTSWSTTIKDLRTAVELTTGVDEICGKEGILAERKK
jgi:hypothetical protein